MQQQPLAFTLVKTVVSARDDGKALSAALATAWDLLSTELSPAHRVIASEVKWAPNHQEDLRFIIEGIRKQFDKDPDLEGEFLAFLAEVEPFGEDEERATILPFVVGSIGNASVSPTHGDVTFEFDKLDVNPAPGSTVDPETSVEDALPEEPHVEPTVESPTIEDSIESLPEVEELPQVETASAKLLPESPITPASIVTPEASGSLLKYWPIAAGALLVAIISFGVWAYSGSTEEAAPAVIDPIETTIPKDTTAFNSPDDAAQNGIEFAPGNIQELIVDEDEVALEYSSPSIALLSRAVDSLRLAGDYAAALTQQQKLTDRIVKNGSTPEETAQAFSELAILYSSQENVLQAIVEQRKGLTFAREAYAKTDPILGRSHLKLAIFYAENEELHMARAHLQQARQIFGESQELISPTDLKKTEQLTERLLKAS
ncbi:MAG: tetratricopeptide repeat protein [Saprospiraceae bacterium]